MQGAALRLTRGSMHWASILTALILALAAAYLMLVKQWSLSLVLALVAALSLGLIAAAFAVVSLVAKPAERAEFVRTVITTIRRDVDELFRWLRLKN